MAERTVVPLDLAQVEPNACEEEQSDESTPLSPTPQNRKKTYGSSMAVGSNSPQGPEEHSTDDIDPFTFEPPFKFWHKLLVSYAD